MANRAFVFYAHGPSHELNLAEMERPPLYSSVLSIARSVSGSRCSMILGATYTRFPSVRSPWAMP